VYRNLNWIIIVSFTLGLFTAFYIRVSIPAQKPPQKPIVIKQAPNIEIKKPELDQAINSILNKYGVTGCSLIVIKNRNNFYHYNYGVANLNTKEKMTSNHAIRIASISKLITAILFLDSIENNTNIINTPVSKLINIPFENPYFKDKIITPKELLTHTSSFAPNSYLADYFLKNSYRNKSLELSSLISSTGNYYQSSYWNSVYPPGQIFNYSGFNFILVAAIIEKITNQRFNLLSHTKLINELEMKNTHLSTSLPFNETKYAIGYEFIEDIPTRSINDNNFYLSIPNTNYVPGLNPTIHAPQSGFRSNAEDLSKVMLMLLNKGTYNNKRILNEKSIELIETPTFNVTQTMQRGIGSEINLGFIPGVKMVGHTGNAYGIITHLFYNREEDFGIVFIINGHQKKAYFGGDHFLIEKEIDSTIYEQLIKKAL